MAQAESNKTKGKVGRPRKDDSRNTQKTTAGREAKNTKAAQAAKNVDDGPDFMKTEVILLVSFLAAIILFLSNFHLCGFVGDYLRSVQLGLFGMIGFIAPLLLFIGTCFFLSNVGNRRAMLKMTAVIAVVLVLCSYAQMFFGGKLAEGAGLTSYYTMSSLAGAGGGLVGGLILSAISAVIGTVGAFLLLAVVLIICIVYITEKSFVSLVKNQGDKAYQYAKEDYDRRMEIHAERAEERRRLREERVRGVDLDATKIVEPPRIKKPDLIVRPGCEIPDVSVGAPPDPVPAAEQKTAAAIAQTAGKQDARSKRSLSDDTAKQTGDQVAATASDKGPTITGLYREEKAEQSEPEDMDTIRIDRWNSSYSVESKTESQAAPQVWHNNLQKTTRQLTPSDIDRLEAEQEAALASSIAALQQEDDSVPFDVDPAPSRQTAAVSSSGSMQGTMAAAVASVAASSAVQTSAVSESPVSSVNAAPQMWKSSSVGDDENKGLEMASDAAVKAEQAELPEPERIPDSYYESQYLDSEPDDIIDMDEIGMDDTVVDDVDFDEIPRTVPDTSTYDDEPGDISLDEGDNDTDPQDEDYYSTTGDEKGVNYDGFFVPEEPKKVVTAGGKIIETDTEGLRKKLESQRQQEIKAAAEAVAEPTVAEEIKEKEIPKKEYIFPPLDLLKKGVRPEGSTSDKEYRETAIKLQQTLQNFGVGVTVTNISCGPSVTRYELHPEQGVKVSKIVALTDDIKLSLAAADIRIEAPIPGKSAVGIEVPNKENNTVYLRDLLENDNFQHHKSTLAFAVGKDIGGQVVVADIAKMPHLLIAGATGSGKSVCINTLIMSVIFKSKPEDVKLIMVDPKVVELSVYNGIPHLLIPVVTDPKKASGALNWAVAEMTDRYKKFAEYNVRDLKGYNEKIKNIEGIDDPDKPQKLPQIVIIIDELADLMMVAPGEVEDAICRLAQLARAAGIHLVIATQRPSVNVITGLIKANVPSRIAFSVSSGVDSRTIIDMNGAEKLLGKGDMLFYPAGYPKPQRVQGAFVSDSEVQKVVDFLADQGITTEYNPEVENKIASPSESGSDSGSSRDEYFAQAGKFIIEKDKASIGMLQRVFKIGFNRAARIMDQLADAGVVGEEEGTKPRKVLMTMDEFRELM